MKLHHKNEIAGLQSYFQRGLPWLLPACVAYPGNHVKNCLWEKEKDMQLTVRIRLEAESCPVKLNML